MGNWVMTAISDERIKFLVQGEQSKGTLKKKSLKQWGNILSTSHSEQFQLPVEPYINSSSPIVP